MKRLDITGERFGRLTVIKYNRSEKGVSFWSCKCDCGNEVEIRLITLRNGTAKSCGCLSRELASKRMYKHGASYTKEHNAWCAMKQRCYNVNYEGYSNYGGRGIKVCDRWLESFENFYGDMGPAPSKYHSLDRINNDGNYEPENVRWATSKQQTRNKSNNIEIFFEGKCMTLSDWCTKLGINYSTAQNRRRKGWPVEKILSKIDYRK